MEESCTFPNNILRHTLTSEDAIIDNMNSYSDSDNDSCIEKDINENWTKKEDKIILEERKNKKYGHSARVYERFNDELRSDKTLEQIKSRSLYLKKNPPKLNKKNNKVDIIYYDKNDLKDLYIKNKYEEVNEPNINSNQIVVDKKQKKRKLSDRFNDLEDCKDFMTIDEYKEKRTSLIGLI